ncbi:MAG TPA: GNAT family N-acetyltransferase [Armatimonadota bacterium]|nr:GNAT family N-acetyltransferase [Armatimonadota bacterium]HOS43648.1 GNAT family N-acetyltransferase [Armatimonadota bacterium]
MRTSRERLDTFWATELGCAPAALHEGGLTVCLPAHRAGPRWMGWMVPVDCVRLGGASPDTGVLSLTPKLAQAYARQAQRLVSADSYLPPNGQALIRFMREHLPTAVPKVHHILFVNEAAFTPAPDVYPVGALRENDPHADWYRLHFDGPVFVARNEWGHIVSWAALKCKSDDVWELAVVTDAPYRGRGLARSVVTRATRAALDTGKLPIYLYDVSNTASARVAQALGYQFYGYELTCEYGRVTRR